MYPGFEGGLNARFDLGFLKKADDGVSAAQTMPSERLDCLQDEKF
ncbi:hypothetical protein CGLO_12774 [Colletotrichum gloeosporioides Cg-14]|uniref:Uncharacterized protein n=1 Tax=Colletotrichum gloeosporioides (strain Cg-14) TaxID=1237896 RepID=T0K7Q5_COLGC|nr:hypothetical protein CGLO_12774 [Colletotrichum gloeosporioides Cg-14]